MSSSQFDATNWRIGNDFLVEFGIECRYQSLTSDKGREVIQKYAIGWAPGENLPCRPKPDCVGVMFYKDGREFWVHLRKDEFYEIFKKEVVNV